MSYVVKYQTGSLQTAAKAGEAVFTCPLKGVKDALLLTQTWSQVVTPTAPWTPLALNTPHPDYPTFFLVEEGPLTDLGGYMASWTRTYAKIPDTYTEPGGNNIYNLIGFAGDYGNVATDVVISGRERENRALQVHIIRDFFLVDPTTGSSGGAGTLASPYDIWESIPSIAQYDYYFGSTDLKVNYIAPAGYWGGDTTPTKEAYLALVAAGTLIAVQMSTLTRWNGLIYMRETLKVKPQ